MAEALPTCLTGYLSSDDEPESDRRSSATDTHEPPLKLARRSDTPHVQNSKNFSAKNHESQDSESKPPLLQSPSKQKPHPSLTTSLSTSSAAAQTQTSRIKYLSLDNLKPTPPFSKTASQSSTTSASLSSKLPTPFFSTAPAEEDESPSSKNVPFSLFSNSTASSEGLDFLKKLPTPSSSFSSRSNQHSSHSASSSSTSTTTSQTIPRMFHPRVATKPVPKKNVPNPDLRSLRQGSSSRPSDESNSVADGKNDSRVTDAQDDNNNNNNNNDVDDDNNDDDENNNDSDNLATSSPLSNAECSFFTLPTSRPHPVPSSVSLSVGNDFRSSDEHIEGEEENVSTTDDTVIIADNNIDSYNRTTTRSSSSPNSNNNSSNNNNNNNNNNNYGSIRGKDVLIGPAKPQLLYPQEVEGGNATLSGGRSGQNYNRTGGYGTDGIGNKKAIYSGVLSREEEKGRETEDHSNSFIDILSKNQSTKNFIREGVKPKVIDLSAEDLKDPNWLLSLNRGDGQLKKKSSGKGLSSGVTGAIEPTRRQRQKHQINWLAQEAADKEMELQDQAASGRLNKYQTHMKYGW